MNLFSPSQLSPNLNPCPPTLRTSNLQFISHLCTHIHQLCLTKTSLLTLSHLSSKYHSLLSNPSTFLTTKPIFTQFFNQIYQFCNQIIDRLKKLDNKKFQPLIKRKLTDIFGCVMRYSYDLRVIAVEEKVREGKRMEKVRRSLKSMGVLVEGHMNVREAFLRIKEECWSCCMLNDRKLKSKWENILWRLNYKLRIKQQTEKRVFLNIWGLNVKIKSMINEKIVGEKVQQFYVKVIDHVRDQEKMHQAILESLRQFCITEWVEYYRYVNNILISYNQTEEVLDSERSIISNNGRITPIGVMKESIDSEEMVTQPMNSSMSRLYIPLKYSSVIGLIVIKYDNQKLDWKEIEMLLKYVESISQVLGKIYQIQSKIEYYTEIINSQTQTAKTLSSKYLNWNISDINYKLFLNFVFKELDMIDVEIGFINNNTQTFYCYPHKQITDRQCVSLISHQFKYQHKPFLQIKKEKGDQIIIPLRQGRQLVGYIKYTSDKSHYSNVDNIESMKMFVNAVISKLKNQETLHKGTSSTRVIQTDTINNVNNIQRSRKILTTETFDEIQTIVKTAITQFKSKLYGAIVWKYNQHYFVHSMNQLHIIKNGDKIYQLLSLKNQQSSQSSHSYSSQQSIFIRQFPCFNDNKIYEYENKNINITIQQLKFQQFTIMIGYFEQSVDSKEITYASSIQPRIPYDDLIEIGRSISSRTKKGFINQDFNTNIFVLNQELSFIRNTIGEQQDLLQNQTSLPPHGKYLCYSQSWLNLKLLEIHQQYPCYQNRISNFSVLLSQTKQQQKEKLEDNRRQLMMKFHLLTINQQTVENNKQTLRNIIQKFRQKLRQQQSKAFKLKQMLLNIQWNKLPLIETFNAFNRQSKLFDTYIKRNQDNTIYLKQKLQTIYLKNIINKIKSYNLLQQQTERNKISYLKQILNIRASNMNTNIQTVLHLLQSKSHKYKQTKSINQQSGLITLSLFFQRKQYSNRNLFFSQTQNQMFQFSESVSTIIEEITLVRMISYNALLTFTQSRLSLYIDRLFNNKNIQINFQLLKLKGADIRSNSNHSSIRNNQNTIVINFQQKQYIVVTLKVLSLSKLITSQIQRLLISIKDALKLIKENIRRKLMLFVKVMTAIQKNILKKGILSLYDNLMICYKGDLSKSFTTVREAQQNLAIISYDDQDDKQNSQIHNQVKEIKQKIIQNNKVIETLKLENKIKKKTFSAALIQQKDFVKQKINCNIREAFTKIKIESQLIFMEIDKQMNYKLMKSGLRSFLRLWSNKNNIQLKQSFNKIVNKVVIQ